MLKLFSKQKILIAAILGLWVTLGVWGAAPAVADSGISLQMEPPSIVENKLYFTVSHLQNASQVRLFSDNSEVASIRPVLGAVESTFTVQPDAKPHGYKAVIYGADGLTLGETNMISFDGSQYLPVAPTWNLTSDETVLSGRLNLNGVVDSRATSVFLAINGKIAYKTTPKNGLYSFKRVALPKQYNWVQVLAENAWGKATTKSAQVDYFNLTPKTKRYVVIDKSELCLFYIEGENMVDVYPVAIGTPRTPTPAGAFIVGEKLVTSPSGEWGARRITLLSRGTGTVYRYAGYNVHGTNQPGSIGKMASHGCVRMFNEDAIALYNRVSKGFEFFIVP